MKSSGKAWYQTQPQNSTNASTLQGGCSIWTPPFFYKNNIVFKKQTQTSSVHIQDFTQKIIKNLKCSKLVCLAMIP